MNSYLCFYKGKKIEVNADTSYAAQQKAAGIFKVKKTYLVSVVLAEKDGVPVEYFFF